MARLSHLALKRSPMVTGKGVLVDKGGLRLMVTYEYVETGHTGRAGRLYSQPMETDFLIFEETFHLEFEDGVAMIIFVTQVSEHRWVFFGRKAGKDAPAANDCSSN